MALFKRYYHCGHLSSPVTDGQT